MSVGIIFLLLKENGTVIFILLPLVVHNVLSSFWQNTDSSENEWLSMNRHIFGHFWNCYSNFNETASTYSSS